jgi:hypothetical protein
VAARGDQAVVRGGAHDPSTFLHGRACMAACAGRCGAEWGGWLRLSVRVRATQPRTGRPGHGTRRRAASTSSSFPGTSTIAIHAWPPCAAPPRAIGLGRSRQAHVQLHGKDDRSTR